MVSREDTTLSILTAYKKRFLKAQAVLKKITNILIKKYHAKRIILIGSLADKHHFGFHSDIDLCVEGLSDNLYFKAVGELLFEADEFDIDIIPFENATTKMKEKIAKGKVLYEKR